MRAAALAALATLAACTTPPPAPPAAPLGFSVAHMDRSADPRRDFYRYAAGGWLDRATIAPTERQVATFTALTQALDAQLQRLVEDAAANPGTSGPRQQIGAYYRAAMDQPRLDSLGLQPLDADLAALSQVDSPAALGRFVARLQLGTGATPLVLAAVAPDPKRNDVNVLYLAPGSRTLERNEYLDAASQPLRERYAAYIAAMLRAAGDDVASAHQQAKTVLELETTMAAATLTPLERNDPEATYHPLAWADARALLPALDLGAFVGALGVEPPGQVLVTEPKALQALQRLLAERSPRDVRTWLRWHLITAMSSALGRPFSTLDREFQRERQGLDRSMPREREVTREIKTLFPHPLSQLYVQAYFPESTRREIEAMVGHIRSEFKSRLETNPWLDEPTRAEALAKLARMRIEVGYPATWIDQSSIVVRDDDHFGNVQRINAFGTRRELARLGRPVTRDAFAYPGFTTPVDVNAAYQMGINGIEITAAIVQPPFYVPGADAAVNYCTIGAVIGHEITHGFDSKGRRFDASGNLRDWWTPAAAAVFQQRTDVLVQQFSGYEVLPGLKLNGALTIGENTADLGGITLAWNALQRHLKAAPPAPPAADGLTPDQRCFVAWAQLWMSKQRPEALRAAVATDVHAVSEFRAAGPLVHLDAFHQAFGIRPGDPMWRPPEQRVRIW